MPESRNRPISDVGIRGTGRNTVSQVTTIAEKKLLLAGLFAYDSSIKPFQTKLFVACQKVIGSKTRIYFLTKSMSCASFVCQHRPLAVLVLTLHAELKWLFWRKKKSFRFHDAVFSSSLPVHSDLCNSPDRKHHLYSTTTEY